MIELDNLFIYFTNVDIFVTYLYYGYYIIYIIVCVGSVAKSGIGAPSSNFIESVAFTSTQILLRKVLNHLFFPKPSYGLKSRENSTIQPWVSTDLIEGSV